MPRRGSDDKLAYRLITEKMKKIKKNNARLMSKMAMIVDDHAKIDRMHRKVRHLVVQSR